MSPHHPSKRSISPQVADALGVAEWWECERAQARFYDRRAAREQATTRLLVTLGWCCAALTATVIGLAILDTLTGAH